MKIKENDKISKLLLGIDESTFNGENSGNTEESQEGAVAIQEMTLNTLFTVETESCDYKLTIEGARATEERNEFSEKVATIIVPIN
ncbi:MAG: hypothetical protein KIC47_01155 [Clostridium sp.]|nr:hypothetical protein [Clostridium sp.]